MNDGVTISKSLNQFLNESLGQAQFKVLRLIFLSPLGRDEFKVDNRRSSFSSILLLIGYIFYNLSINCEHFILYITFHPE